MTDQDYIRRCIALARLGEYYVAPNPMVGAVLVDADGKIIGEGWHRQYGGPHAEVNCFADADRRAIETPDTMTASEGSGGNTPGTVVASGEDRKYPGCTLYVSLEPCSHYGKTPPCANLVVRKGVKRVVIGCLDPNPQVSGRGVKILEDAGIEVTTGVLEDECRWLNRRFLTLQEKKRPYVILKWAQTEDGYLDALRAVPEGSESSRGSEGSKVEPLQISNGFTKQLVHKLRAENMAILVGSGTVLADDPHLTTKHWPGRNPIRVVLDRRKRIPETARVFSPDAETIVYSENTDWDFVLADLGRRGIHSLIVEGGAKVLGTIIAGGIWDEIHVETAPIRIGKGVEAPSSKFQTKIAKTITEIYEKNHILTTYLADNGFVGSK